MMDWLRPLLLMFYAPARGMAEARDRAPLGQSALLALAAQAGVILYALWPLLPAEAGAAGFVVQALLSAAGVMIMLAAFFVPAAVFVSNLLERRGSFGLVLRQEYAATLSCAFYALAAAGIVGILLLALLRVAGIPQGFEAGYREALREAAEGGQMPPEHMPLLADAEFLPAFFSFLFVLPLLFLWLWVGVREVFRAGWGRAFVAALGASGLCLFASPVLPFVSLLLGSPFLLLLLLFAGRAYFGEAVRGQRARAAFRQNLEAATLNPADASAHYNLGLIHLQRKELDEARARFERAAEIDPEYVDTHYQLGRIARTEGRLPDAIRHFGEVVERDDAHSQHEVWREVGATYLAAGQFADAGDALSRFLERRQSDAEGLYLMGRAAFGLGDMRGAREWMQRCVDAVRTAPAYKYRADKRWLNEAQQFLRTNA